jgi:hypothetical protein
LRVKYSCLLLVAHLDKNSLEAQNQILIFEQTCGFNLTFLLDKSVIMAGGIRGLGAHWKCMLACILVSMSPFQYGIDFGLIGPMQAMVGFLKVCTYPSSSIYLSSGAKYADSHFLQVFGYVDPATPVGYNISPGVQQLITSLMTLGAFVGSLAAGKLPYATVLASTFSILMQANLQGQLLSFFPESRLYGWLVFFAQPRTQS